MAVHGICTHLRDSINSGLARWQLTVEINAVVESGRKKPFSKHSLCGTGRPNLSRETKFSGATEDIGN